MSIIANPTGSGAPASGITFNDVIEKTLRRLHSGEHETLNQLAADITDTSAAIQLTHGTNGIIKGSLIAIGMELFYVWDVDTTTSIVTVQRAYADSTAGAHTGGDIVVINPKYPRFSIGDAVNDELQSLVGRGLFQMRTVDLTFSTATIGYDLGVNDVIDIYEIKYRTPTSFRNWIHVPSSYYSWEGQQSSDDFATGSALYLRAGGYPGQPVRVFYKAGFNRLVNLTDDVQTTAGLHSEAADILSAGAAVRIMAPEEISRNDLTSQGDSRRPGEVPPGAVLRSYQGLATEREQRIFEERTRLERKWNMRRGGY